MDHTATASNVTELQEFLSRLSSRPHVAANIVKRLDLCDIANCLKVSKLFRHFIIDLLVQFPQFKTELENKSSRLALTEGKLNPKEYGPLDDNHWKYKSPDKKFGFGIDGSLWVCRPSLPVGHHSYVSSSSMLGMHTLNIYDIKSIKRVKTIEMLYNYGCRPRVRILPNHKVLLLADFKLWVLAKDGNSYKTLFYHIMSDVQAETEATHKDVFENDCIFRSMMHHKKEFKREIDLCGSDGDLMYNNTIKTNVRPRQILEKGCYVMVVDHDTSGLSMFDSSDGRNLWDRNDIIGTNEQPYSTVLTETFCGFIYPDYASNTETLQYGTFKLRLFYTPTGQEIYNGSICDFHCTDNSILSLQPKVIASGNYLFACCMKNSGASRLLCVKVDPKNRTFKVRITITGLEPVILAKTLSDGKAAGHICKSEVATQYQTQNTVSIVPDSLRFLGQVLCSVVLCQAQFNYIERRKTYYSGKVVFTVDLDKILHMEEPTSVFSAVHFPLDQNVFDTFDYMRHHNSSFPSPVPVAKVPLQEYYPHYETIVENQSTKVELTGIINVSHNFKEPVKTEVYSFKRALEVMDLDEDFAS